jgi:uncharacterized protein
MSGGDWKDLFKVAGEGDVHLVRYHLQAGVDPNFQHSEYFSCPIFEAVRNGHLDCVKILVEEGNADPGIVEESSDETPIEAALATGHYNVVDYLNDKLSEAEKIKFHNVLVTGGNRGIGKAICESLLKKGHRVVFTCRSEEAAVATMNYLKATTKNEKLDYIIGNLSSIDSAFELAAAVVSKSLQ